MSRFGKMEGLLAIEREDPLQWYYVSFATPAGFLGAVIVEAHGVLTAARRAHELGLHGGEVLAIPIPADELPSIPGDLWNRILSEQDMRERLGAKTIAEHEADEIASERKERASKAAKARWAKAKGGKA